MTKKEEDDVRRRSTIQVLEYARSLGAYNRYGKADIDKNIAWLKKQGEQKKQVHFPKFTFNDVIALQCCMETVKKVQEDKELYEQLNLIHSKIYNDYWLGKQDELSPILSNFSNTEENEQKSNENKDEMIKTDILNDLKIIKLYEPPVISNSSNTETINKKLTNKIEPKFKVGDWIVFVKHGSTYQVEKIENYEYTLKHISGGLLDLPFSDENLIREWTIQDAEDGDVLTCNEDIFIFKSYSELQSSISLYCWYNGKTNNFFDGKVTYVSLNKRNKICPATKEQRDILYQKIEEEKNNNVSINKNIDLTNILKNCPKGTKFYSSLWGEISFERILEKEVYAIEINTVNGCRRLTKEGYYITSDDAECIIFPSKDQKDWSKFTAPWYKNEELIKPKFKVGDIIKHKGADKDDVHEVYKVYNDSYALFGYSRPLLMKYQDVYELVPNKFDPHTLKPFDKVIGRDSCTDIWRCTFYSHTREDESILKYITIDSSYKYCIPYNDDTKHLVGTRKEEPEYYKYWED